MHKTIFVVVIAFVMCLLQAHTTYAYLTTNQEATALPDHSALFVIDYVFGTEKHALHMPVLAHAGQTTSTSSISYSIVDDDGNVVAGKTAGIVFSNAILTKKGMYVTRKGFKEKFSLMVLYTPTSYDPEMKYRLQVTNLPFSFDGKQQLQLNPSELQYYTTKLIRL